MVGRRKAERVGHRDQRRALTARRHVAGAEVVHDPDAEALGEHRRLTQLQRDDRRLVPEGLAREGDRGDGIRPHVREFQGDLHGVRGPLGERHVEARRVRDGAARQHRLDPPSLDGAVRSMSEADQLDVGRPPHTHDRRIHAVERRARHESDDKHRRLAHDVPGIGGGGPTIARKRRSTLARRVSASAYPSWSCSITIAVRTSPWARAHRVSRDLALDAEHLHHDAFAAITQLGVGGLQVDHEVAVRLPDANHRAGGQHVEHQLGRGAGLESRRTGHQLRTDVDMDQDVAPITDARRAARRR